jgi:hypothetical protein
VARLLKGYPRNRGLNSQQEQGIFLFSKASKVALEATQPLYQEVPLLLSLRVKRLGLDVTAYLHLGPRIKVNGITPPLPQIPSRHTQGQLQILVQLILLVVIRASYLPTCDI